MNTVMLFDTSVASLNIGDQIIMDATQKQLRKLFPDDYFLTTSTHDIIGKQTFMINEMADFSFLGGSNILNDKFSFRNKNQWRLSLFSSKKINDVISIGCGRSNYDVSPFIKKVLQKQIYNHCFSQSYLHSVRDSFTEKKFTEFGFPCINTSCVTLWDFIKEFCSTIRKEKADKVVATITYYKNSSKDYKRYNQLFSILNKMYEHIYFFAQDGVLDLDLFNNLEFEGKENVEIVTPSLEGYDLLLKSDAVDFVGTRLHGGIRAMQHKQRAIIIEIDNRAKEISKDVNLCTVSWDELEKVEKLISSRFKNDIQIPFDKVNQWKDQFKS